MNQRTILIKHSGGCYYNRMLLMVEKAIKQEFVDVEIIDEVLPCISGAFEVQIENKNKKTLVHSKLNNGTSILKENIEKFMEKTRVALK